jgi:AcrR family transcriptional regulator
MMAPVSVARNSRRYDGSARRARAAAQHDATLGIARALFLERGYTATTVAAIAEAAGVSAATIYKSHGGKAGLVRELCARALAGEGPVPAHDRSDALRGTTDARAVIDGWGRLLGEVSPRLSPLLLLLRDAAAADPDAAALRQEQDRARLERMAENARFLAESGHLRAGVDVDEARDVLWLCSSPELYEVLVAARGWSGERLGAFASTTMVAALLDG